MQKVQIYHHMRLHLSESTQLMSSGHFLQTSTMMHNVQVSSLWHFSLDPDRSHKIHEKNPAATRGASSSYIRERRLSLNEYVEKANTVFGCLYWRPPY